MNNRIYSSHSGNSKGSVSGDKIQIYIFIIPCPSGSSNGHGRK